MLEQMFAWFSANHWAEHLIQAVIVWGGAMGFVRWVTSGNREDLKEVKKILLASKGSADSTQPGPGLEARIDGAEWDWDRFKKSDRARPILEDMYRQSETDNGPKDTFLARKLRK